VCLVSSWHRCAARPDKDEPDEPADTWSSAKILYDPDASLARLRDHVTAIVARGKPPLDPTRTHSLRVDDSTTEKLRLAHLALPLVFDPSS